MRQGARNLVIALAFAAVIAVPSTTHATSATFLGPIVPDYCHCDNQTNPAGGTVTTAPDYGCILDTAHNAVNFGVTVATILFTIYLVITGFAFILSGGSSEARSAAKTRFLNVFIGLAVLLCAWLLVDFLMKSVGYDEGKFGPWNAILAGTTQSRCILVTKPTPITAGQVAFGVPVGTSATTGTPAPGSSGAGCNGATPTLVNIDSTHQLAQGIAQQFLSMKAAAAQAGVTINVESAYRSDATQLGIWNSHGCSVATGHTVCARTIAAEPCSLGGPGSNHERGDAVDVASCGGAVNSWLQANAGNYGFHNSLGSIDPCHWSTTGR